MKKVQKILLFILIIVILLVVGIYLRKRYYKNEGKLRFCPDAWTEDRMPGAVMGEFFMVNGEVRDLSEFDLWWVKNNCNLQKQIVY